MFTTQVYKIAVLSLSGIMEEVYTAQEVIRKYKQENAERTGKLFLPVAGDVVISDADVVIGIVGNYIDKAEVIEEAVKAGKKVLLFFSKYQDPENTIPVEGKAVEEFKNKMESKCTCCEFNGKGDFETLLSKAIEIKKPIRTNKTAQSLRATVAVGAGRISAHPELPNIRGWVIKAFPQIYSSTLLPSLSIENSIITLSLMR